MNFGDIFTGLDKYVMDDPVEFVEAVWPKEPPICVPREPIELMPKTDYEKRQELIDKLRKIIADLENGCDGFMYLYNVLFK